MKEGFSLKTLFPGGDEHLKEYNFLGDRIILSIFTIVTCLVGLVGNGTVIWLLSFRVGKKPFATYILNLAVADFGCLVVVFPLHIFFSTLLFVEDPEFPFILWGILVILLIMYFSCLLLLTAIGIDRCVSVLFPNWYRCHQSPVWSATVCALIWVLSLVLNGGPFIVPDDDFQSIFIVFVYLGTILICYLLIPLCALTLLIKVCFQSQPCQCGNLLKAVLHMLLSFLLFTILTFACAVMNINILDACSALGVSVKSSINPLIYFLAGRQKGSKFGERIKTILTSVFREERDSRIEMQPHIETRL